MAPKGEIARAGQARRRDDGPEARERTFEALYDRHVAPTEPPAVKYQRPDDFFTAVYDYYIALMCPSCGHRNGEIWRKPGEDEVRVGSITVGCAHGFAWPYRAEIDRLARQLSRKKLNPKRRFSGRGGRLDVILANHDNAGPDEPPAP